MYIYISSVSIRFFNDVGQVVRVLLQATHKGKCVGEGFVEFASANQAKKVRLVHITDELVFTYDTCSYLNLYML